MNDKDLEFFNELVEKLKIMLINVKDENGNYRSVNKVLWEIGEKCENFKINLALVQSNINK